MHTLLKVAQDVSDQMPDGKPRASIVYREVSNYVVALDYGLRRLGEGFPLSLHLIKDAI